MAVVSDYDFPTGGVEVFTQQVLKETADQLDTTLVTWTGHGPAPPDSVVVRIEHGDLQQLWRVLDAADVVLVLTSFNVRALAWLTCDYLHVTLRPAVSVVHTSEHSTPGFHGSPAQVHKLQQLVRLSTHSVAVSNDVAAGLTRLFDEAPPIRVIENAARRLPASPHTTSRTRGRRRVSYIGRPSPQKGFGDFQRLAHDLHDLRLEFSANTVSIPVAPDDPITYSANLSDSELREFFDTTDILVAPYLRADGLPLALLEALACGVPIVGYESAGVGPLLRRYNQLVIPPAYDDLAKTIRDWAAGSIRLQAPPAEQVPTWREAAAEYVEVLRSAAAVAR